jgi:dihydroorotate dehydrogenase electron transfer subunit
MTGCVCHSKTDINDFDCIVTKSEKLADRIAWLSVQCPELAKKSKPGQSVMIFTSDTNDPLLGRPFSIADADLGTGEISVCYMVLGRGTDMMTKIKIGSEVKIRGLLGIPFPKLSGHVYLTAGGAGAAIFLRFARIFKTNVAGYYVGLPGAGYEKYAEKLRTIVPDVHIFADDSTFGEGNSMFQVLPENLNDDDYVLTCGPEGFINAIKQKYSHQLDRVYLTFDRHMACGYGGCMGCVVKTKNGLRRLCVDQSLFRADEVLTDD